jgi:DNA-binding NarL/FixJ family response regulator/type II secretory pathway predicted ATPase ExeA
MASPFTSSVVSRGPGSPVDSTVALLVGREHEQHVLRERLMAAQSNRGGLVLLSGESGIGKTALAAAFCQEAQLAAATVLVGRCYSLSITPPYGPWAEMLAVSARSDLDRPTVIAESATQAEVFAGVRDSLARRSQDRPVVVLLEDFHWADRESLSLLRAVARWAKTRSVLLLITCFGDELPGDQPFNQLLPAIERESRVARIELRPLSKAAQRDLVAARYGLPNADTARLIDHLHHLADGNALFTVQLLDALEEEGVLRRAGGAWTLGQPEAAHVPRGPRQLVEQHLRRMNVEDRSRLRSAAVLGHRVSVATLALAVSTDEQSLVSTVEAATAIRLIEQAPDGASFRFTHGLVREALYQGISPVRRRAEHRRIAETLAALADPDPDVVAYHFDCAGDQRTAQWSVLAGERAERSGASLTATARYRAALDLRDALPPTQRAWVCLRLALLLRFRAPRDAFVWVAEAEHIAGDLGDPRLTARVPLVRGMVRACADGIRGGLDDVAAGVALVDDLPPDPTNRSGPQHQVDQAVNRGMLAAMQSWAGRLDDAKHEYGLVFAGGDAVARSGAAWAAGFTAALQGEPDPSGRYFAQARAGLEAIGDYHSLTFAARDELSYLVVPYLCDQPDRRSEIVRVVSQAINRAMAVGALDEPTSYAQYPILPLMIVDGRWREAHRSITELLEHGTNAIMRRVLSSLLGSLAREQGDRKLAWRSVWNVWPHGSDTNVDDTDLYYSLPVQRLAAQLAIDDGDLNTARSWLESHDRWLAWSGAILGAAETESVWSCYFAQIGDSRRARDRAERALARASQPRQPLALLAAHRRLGSLDLHDGRLRSAARHLASALRLADACNAPHERAQTLASQAELYLARGDRTTASHALVEAQMICASMGAARTLGHVNDLIAHLAGTVEGARPAGLTRREAEVLGLLARGHSNKEIAARLVLSVRTVERHVTAAYRKIGAKRRTEAMVYALLHGLARIETADPPRSDPDLT